MEEFVEKDSFEFGDNSNNEQGNFEYNDISGLGESNYENEDLFNSNINNDVQEVEQVTEVHDFNFKEPVEINDFSPSFELMSEEQPNNFIEEPIIEENNEDSFYKPVNVFENEIIEENNNEDFEQIDNTFEDSEPIEVFKDSPFDNPNFTFGESEDVIKNIDDEDNQNLEIEEAENFLSNSKIDNEFLEENPETFNNSMSDNFEYEVVAPIIEPSPEEKIAASTNIISDTPIEELNKLTEYEEEKISVTDIKALFNRVGTNVQEASDIFIKNTEMKEKIDAKFEELKQLQAQVENAKKTQYDEINSYKEEVFGKLNEKKNEVEDRINKLKEFQDNLEKEKEEFEKYKKEQTDEIERVQKEVQDAYESRREELNHIEDVLRKQKDSLDEERNQLSLDKIQYEADKNELANNLLKFNQIVDSFTIGMESAGKEE